MEQRWRKSSYSGNDADCVELSWTPTHSGVRDSKNPAAGTLTLTEDALIDLVRTAKVH